MRILYILLSAAFLACCMSKSHKSYTYKSRDYNLCFGTRQVLFQSEVCGVIANQNVPCDLANCEQ